MTTKSAHLKTIAAAYTGWTLDAFDFFIMATVLDDVAHEFHTTRTITSAAITLTLAARPLGALIFGRLADTYGRKPILMANILAYSLFAFLSGLAPSLTAFFIIRTLFGVAMGGVWGVGASLVMETIPSNWRGRVSGLLQAGYPSGFLLATIATRLLHDQIGWRGLFMLGAAPALLVFFINRHVGESSDFIARKAASKAVAKSAPNWSATWRTHLPRALFAIAMMTLFNVFSHGTQDLFPSFLRTEHHLPPATVSNILIAMNIAAMFGGLTCGFISQRLGRRRTIVFAALLSLPVIPFWAFAAGPVSIAIAAFALQIFVQGAWGVVPAHLNELSPPEIRATFPGVTYQLGNLIASTIPFIQTSTADAFFGGALNWPLALTVGPAALLLTALVRSGPEASATRMNGAIE